MTDARTGRSIEWPESLRACVSARPRGASGPAVRSAARRVGSHVGGHRLDADAGGELVGAGDHHDVARLQTAFGSRPGRPARAEARRRRRAAFWARVDARQTNVPLLP